MDILRDAPRCPLTWLFFSPRPAPRDISPKAETGGWARCGLFSFRRVRARPRPAPAIWRTEPLLSCFGEVARAVSAAVCRVVRLFPSGGLPLRCACGLASFLAPQLSWRRFLRHALAHTRALARWRWVQGSVPDVHSNLAFWGRVTDFYWVRKAEHK
ncbi:hypothetical protein TRVL_09728 [Trypanosoma vivax]|nr:hypothetical protein TRVL_09728 [Trypanosoma vivax]